MIAFYDKFHRGSRNQFSLISKQDFTYKNTLKFLEPYIQGNLKILDVGCGIGSIDFYLGSLGKVVLGVDISRVAVKTATTTAKYLGLTKSVKFRVMDFPRKKPKSTFHILICSEVLEHLRNDKFVVEEMCGLLKTNGFLIASSPSKNAPLYKIGLLKKFDKEVGHLRRYSLEQFRKLFEQSGLEVLEVKEVEGIFRNFLFTNSFGRFLLKVLKRPPLSELVTFIDNLTVWIIGGSDIYLVARKK